MKTKTSEDRIIELEMALREVVHQIYGLIELLKNMPVTPTGQKITIGFLEQAAEIGTTALLRGEEGGAL